MTAEWTEDELAALECLHAHADDCGCRKVLAKSLRAARAEIKRLKAGIIEIGEEEDCCALHHHEGNLCCLTEAGLRRMSEDVLPGETK